MHDTNALLTLLLAAHEGGNPPITISYDDATRNYAVSQPKRFTLHDQDLWRGYGHSPLGAILNLIESQAEASDAQR